jgi:hypothetical protein
VATREQVQALLDSGYDYATAARELGEPEGRLFMIATGLAADGSGVPTPREPEDGPALPGSSQQLVNPPELNPTRKQHVIDWVRGRAARELTAPGS